MSGWSGAALRYRHRRRGVPKPQPANHRPAIHHRRSAPLHPDLLGRVPAARNGPSRLLPLRAVRRGLPTGRSTAPSSPARSSPTGENAIRPAGPELRRRDQARFPGGMALSKPSAALDRRRVMPAFTATNTGFMPVDAVYEILLRVPAKDACRFRAVCRPWRSLLSDPQFIAAHASHHPGPLIVAGCHTTNPSHRILCEIMDLSGRVVKRVRSTWARNEWLVFAQLELICTAKGNSKSFRLLNPADGVMYSLPEGLSEEHAELDICNYRAGIVFGKVASTGVYKVLRVLGCHFDPEQLFEVLTLDGSIDSGWRGKEAPLFHLEMQSRVVINGMVYFFSNEVLVYQHATLRHIASFDLETEEWRATLEGPQINRVDDAVDMLNDQAYCPDLSMADLNGTLAVVSCHHSSMDLWFLISFEKNLWVKQHSIKLNLSVQHDEFHIRPLLVLNDGRIVTYIGTRGLLRIYNPANSTYTDLAEMGPRIGIGLYTGNLLSLANGAS